MIPRHRFSLPLRALLIVGASVLASANARPQGVAGAAISGTVVTAAGVAVPRAVVALTEISTGASRTTIASSRGNFGFDYLSIGQYAVRATALGLRPSSAARVTLHVDDHAHINLVLGETLAQSLDTVSVAGRVSQENVRASSLTIGRETVQRLPLLNRDFIGLLSSSSQAAGPNALWVSGQHARFNSITVDGSSINDLFGTTVAAGTGSGGRAISLEALEEIRVAVAPFDVRHGGFSGALINAVTRSGTNTPRVAAFTSVARSTLVGSDSAGLRVADFSQLQYGVSAGGPIVRDRLHFFAVAEMQYRVSPFSGPSVSDVGSVVSDATAMRAAQIFRDRFAFDAGDARAPQLAQPNANYFAKLSWHPSSSHVVELTQSLANSRSEGLSRSVTTTANADGWQLSNSGSVSQSLAATTRIKLTSTRGAVSNEAMASDEAISQRIDSHNQVPLFIVGADVSNNYLSGGSVKGAQGTKTTQHIVELTDNLSWSVGAHIFTVGAQTMLLRVRDNFVSGAWGTWTFANVDALANGEPSAFERVLVLHPDKPLVDFSTAMLSAYAQDQWQPLPHLLLTAGVRADAAYAAAPLRNEDLAAKASLGHIATDQFPSGNALSSPRVGFVWTVDARRRSIVRGGIGTFTARPPFAWLTGAFSSTGTELTTVTCRASDGVPLPTSDLSQLPSRCLRNTAAPVPTVTVIDPQLRFPQATKYQLGVDHQLFAQWHASLDVIVTQSRTDVMVDDVNLVERGQNAEGRMMYGTITTTGAARPLRVDSMAFGPVYRFSNISRDRSASASAIIEHGWSRGGLLSLAYTWSHTQDVMSMSGFSGPVILRSNPVDGALSRRALRTSARDVPHTVVVTALAPLPHRFVATAFARARSGTPYSFTISNDANADGVVRNDLAYVPRDASDPAISNPTFYPALDSLIARLPCLRNARGRILTRNACRNPWVTQLDARLSKQFSRNGAHAVEIAVDILNLPNLVNKNWGIVRETSDREDVPLLAVSGWDATTDRLRYAIPVSSLTKQAVLPSINHIVTDISRWRLQISLRAEY